MFGNTIKSSLVATSVILSGCSPYSSPGKAQEYMQNKPQQELDEVLSSVNKPVKVITLHDYAVVQSKLDSVAYKDIFMTTNAVKDSTKLAEFNKIAGIGRMTQGDLTQKLKETGITVKEFDKIIDEAPWTEKRYEHFQFATDSINYHKFFKKHNLLNKKTLKMIKDVSKRIKP